MVNSSVSSRSPLPVRVTAIERAASDIAIIDLSADRGQSLPAFTAGGHIDVHLPNDLTRSYSLVNREQDRDRYRIAVRKNPDGGGGSVFLHEKLRLNDNLSVSAPRNNFELSEAAEHSVFIAGGIGITPLWSMIQRMQSLDRSWNLHYCVRSPEHALFLRELTDLEGEHPGRVRLYFDRAPAGRFADLGEMIRAAPDHSHFYCCGPAPMLEDFLSVTAAKPADRVHLERFTSTATPVPKGGFVVQLAHSGRQIEVPPGRTILEALLANHIDVPYSCREGVCGACEVGVLAGTPDHRDSLLSVAEQASGRTMLVCCSGSLSQTLVLDL